MAKVYAVYCVYHEHDIPVTDVYNSETMEKLFDSEEKAIDYICEKIESDHKHMDSVYPGDECLIKHSPNRKSIERFRMVKSYEYAGILTYISVMYRFTPYDVE